MATLETIISTAGAAVFNGAGTNYVVQTPSGVIYMVGVDSAADVYFAKSSDGGLSWTRTTVFTGTTTNLAIWYDRSSNISAGLIHCVYTESVTDDTRYRSIDTESSDALGTETTVFAGTDTASGGALSIVRARGGNLYVKTMIDAGAEGGFFRSTDVGATWGSRTDAEALATTDQWILLPGWAADNQDIMAIFWDASANEISRYLNDDSADSWAETSIAASMSDRAASNDFPHFAATVDITNSRNVVVAWSGVDTANADLRCWTVTESAITETATNVVLNSTDDQGLAAIGIDTDTGDWHVYYGGKSDGTETFNTAVHIYRKISTDDGATWGDETAISAQLKDLRQVIATPRFATDWVAGFSQLVQNATCFSALLEVDLAGNAKASGNMTGGLQ